MSETVVAASEVLRNSWPTNKTGGHPERLVIYATADRKGEALVIALKSSVRRRPHPCPVSGAALTVRCAIETMGRGGVVCDLSPPRPPHEDGPLRDVLRLRDDMKVAIGKIVAHGQPRNPDATE